ncbi:MAG: LysM peptidoglycan-binding domain-containing protein [Armatimonadota bacterium]|nr:LysM peptidoglycan-binding domain-containing protein [Armatimonadota bacterium]MDR7550071.1 LysM peptidoglycan-binding domain-containing protein [Armatimonadota bacterium]
MRTAAWLACVAVVLALATALGVPEPVASQPPVRSRVDRAVVQPLRDLSALHPPVARETRLTRASAGAPPRDAATSRPGIGVPRASTRPTRVTPSRVHTVRSGDTLWGIASRYGVTVERLAEANRIQATSTLSPGRSLVIPPQGGGRAPARTSSRPEPPRPDTVTHVVQPGDTLWDIASRYGTRVEDLMAYNDLGDSEWIRPGQRLVISGRALPRHRQVAAQSRSPRRASEQEIEALAGGLAWPARGTLTSRFGWRYRRHHDGIDLASPRGTPIYAARDGVVEFAGWKAGYGRVVIVSHGGGLVTVYGHASSLLVRAGESVKKGQVIARVGCTGSCTGSHLHFEVRHHGRPINPLPYLR